MKDTIRSWGDLALGLFLGAVLVIGLAGLDTPKYTIECRAVEDVGIEYTVYHKTFIRKDPIYRTLDATMAYAMWYGMYANREGVGYYITPSMEGGENGVYNPDDLARGK